MTKPIVSTVALHLIEREDLSLSEPVSDFVPGFGEAGVLRQDGGIEPVQRPPTIRDLLSHTAGVTYGQFGNSDIHRRYGEARVFDYSSTNAENAAKLARLPLLHQPGSCFEYGMSTDLLGRVIETVTGVPLDQAMQDIVFGPLGMSDTGFAPDRGRLAELPPSDVQRQLAPGYSRAPTWYSGGAGLFSTVPDYMRFARMLKGGGQLDNVRIIRPETVIEMCQQHLPKDVGYGAYTQALGISAPGPENGLGFGLGVAVRTVEMAGIPGGLGEYFWTGISGGNFWVDPKNDLIVVFLTHAPMYRTKHRVELRDAIYGGLEGQS